MPYIKPNERDLINNELNILIRKMQKYANHGMVNYVISRIINEVTLSHTCYIHIMQAIGTLECAKLELYRHIAGPYEDQKIKENGDI